jgi:WD40 repeat protein
MDGRQFHKTVLVGAAGAVGLPVGARPSGAGPSKALPPHPGDALPHGAAARLGTTRFWYHEKCGDPGVSVLAFSPDGTVLAALGYQDGVLSLWEVPSGRMVREWQADEADRRGELLFSPCGGYLAQAGYEGLSLWDPASGQFLRRLTDHREPHQPFVFGVAFSPDGRFLAGAVWYTGAVVVWETATGERVVRLEADPQSLCPDNPWGERSDFFSCVAFTADGQRVAAGGTYKVFLDPNGAEAEAVRRRRRESGAANKSLAPANVGVGVMDGQHFLEHRGRVRCWELGSGRQVAKLDGHEFGVGKMSFLPDGRLVSYAEDGEVWVWDVEAGRRVSELAPSAGNIGRTAIAFAADRRHAVLSRQGYLGLLDLLDGKEVHRFPVRPDWHGWRRLAVSADTSWVATGSAAGRLDLWDATTGADVSPPARHASTRVQAVRFTPDGRVATATAEDAILWNAATGALLGHVQGCGHLLAGTMAPSPDGKRAACVRRLPSAPGTPGRDSLITWDWQTGEVQSWEECDVTPVAWLPDAESIVAVTRQEELCVLDLRTGSCDRPWNDGTSGVQTAALSADARLVGALDRSLRVHVWERSPGGWSNHLAIPDRAREKNSSPVFCGWLLFAPDGHNLALATRHGEVCLGRVDGHELPVVFSAPPASDIFPSEVGIGFLPAGRLLLAKSYHAGGEEESGTDTVRVFDVAAGREVWASPALPRQIGALAFSPDCRTLASGLSDGTTLLWTLDTIEDGPSKGATQDAPSGP